MFMGRHSHNIDSKGRVIIPAKMREQLGEHFVVTRGFEECIAVYSMEAWEKVMEALAQLPSNQKSARRIKRMFLSYAVEVEPDKQGKVIIPSDLREIAQLDKEVLVVGQENHVEIWNVDKWNEYMDDEEEMSFEEAAEALDGFCF